MKKLLHIDENIIFLFAGLSADAHKLVDIVGFVVSCFPQARVEAQSYRMSFDEVPSVKYIANYVGRQQQMYIFVWVFYRDIHNVEVVVLLVCAPLFVAWMEIKGASSPLILLVL